jgi:phosphonate transport system ATP-binding protein
MTPFDDSPPMASTTHPADALVLTGVHVHRGDGAVLHGIDLTFPAGRITAIVGRSGVGKSTLIATLNGLIHPEAGTIAVPGVGRIDDAGALREHRRRTATIFQDHALIDRLSALDNVLLGLADQRHPLSLLPWPEEFRRRAARKSG